MKRGLIVVFTGEGKGKTTAALGLAMRALGHEYRVGMVQFIKGPWKSGELISAKRFEDLMDIYTLGRGFLLDAEDIEKDKEAAKEAWEFAKDIIIKSKYDIVILDELTYLIKYKMVEEDEVIDFLIKKPDKLHIVITGRDASSRLIDVADMVTEMKEIKHPLNGGIKCQKGIEF
ncbi:MAG TPA: cob(I)yrinic acid a,c-diamide adenosyltransferase [Spirochaetes bacterium]|nr:cob(I)yrinic acid a,c-diamide adenosyltransferase [Spirochaetota bacterium]